MHVQEIRRHRRVPAIDMTEIFATLSNFLPGEYPLGDFPITITITSDDVVLAEIIANDNGQYSSSPTIPADFASTSVSVKSPSDMSDTTLDVKLVRQKPVVDPKDNGKHIRVVIRNYPVVPGSSKNGHPG